VAISIDPEVVEQVRRIFKLLEHQVTLNLFLASESKCPYCREAEEIVNLISRISPKVNVRKYYEGSREIKKYNIDKYPAIIVHGKEEYNVRYFGVPAGYEFGVLVEDILYASKGKPDLPENIIERVRRIDKPVHIQVFTTPTCPYCPYVAKVAHMFAIANNYIVSDVINAVEFPELVEKFKVYAVPKVIINNKVTFEGSLTEEEFLRKIEKAL